LLLLLVGQCGLAQDMPLSQVLKGGEEWQKVGAFTTATALAANRTGEVFVAQGKEIHRIGADGKTSIFARTSAPVSALSFTADGRLLACAPASDVAPGQLLAFTAVGKEVVLQERSPARSVLAGPAGEVYFTGKTENGWAVFLLGHMKPVGTAPGQESLGGMTLTPDGGTLVVGCPGGKHLFAFRVEMDGTLSARERYFAVSVRRGQKEGCGAGGLTADRDRRIYAALPTGVQVFDPTGRFSGELLRPKREPVTAVVFGATERDRLFVICGGAVYARQVKARGIPPQAPARPRTP
jgi:sugar lactone lactonase YvrE